MPKDPKDNNDKNSKAEKKVKKVVNLQNEAFPSDDLGMPTDLETTPLKGTDEKPRKSRKTKKSTNSAAEHSVANSSALRQARKQAEEAKITAFNYRNRYNFLNRVDEVTTRDDAFTSLPITIIFTLVFVGNIVGHLRIQERQMLEKALETYVNGRDPRETASENVDDMDSWWEWVQGPGTTGPFAKVLQDTSDVTQSRCRMASRNFLLGDVRISYQKFNGDTDKQWLLQSASAQAVLSVNPTSFSTAAQAGALYYQTNGWDDKEIEFQYLEFNAYNEFSRMFSRTQVKLPLKKSGYARTVINTEAFAVEPYQTYNIYVFDLIYFLLVLYITLLECKQMKAAAGGGLGELLDYFDLPCICDWMNIILSFSCIVSWLYVVMAMTQTALTDLINDEYKLTADVMRYDADKLDKIDSAISTLAMSYAITQFLVSLSTVFIVLKFFKCFVANERLNVPLNTLRASAVDVFHFLITLLTIYFPLNIMAHVLFGNDLESFSSAVASLNTGFYVMMGDFGWYVEATQGMIGVQTLPSGMPLFFLLLWYFVYMFLVVMVMLNMLMAIVMEHYVKCVEKVHTALEKPAIWTQAKEYRSYRKATKGFVTLEQILLDLEDDDEPAHPEEEMTPESIKEAWPKMTDANIEWLLKWFQAHLDRMASREGDTLEKTLDVAKSNRDIMEGNSARQESLCKLVHNNRIRLDKVHGRTKQMVKAGTFKPCVVKWQKQMEAARSCIADVSKSLGKIRRDIERQARRIEDITLAIPEEAKRRKPAANTESAKPPSQRVSASSAPTLSNAEEIKEKKDKKEKKEKKAMRKQQSD